MYNIIIEYTDSSISTDIKLIDFKKFLKLNNYVKPYRPFEKYLIKFIFQKYFNVNKCNKDIVSFEIKE